MSDKRKEKDFLGEMDVPSGAYYGIQTLRAVENFPISGLGTPLIFTRACAMIKKAAAQIHREFGMLEPEMADAIMRAADEVIDDRFEDEFVVDVFQAGAGTSHHMNVNEVIANRASEIMGGKLGEYSPVHPNDHVNMGQSTNDVFPTAMRLAILMTAPDLVKSLQKLAATLGKKGKEFKSIGKSGRTHLQDAAPVTLGQEFSAYAATVTKAASHIEEQTVPLRELGIGGSATGTGLNTQPDYGEKMTVNLAKQTGIDLTPSKNLFETMQSMAPFVRLSGALRAAAVELGRICNDLRLLSSGPRTGLGEIRLPAVQPGSSIMPGKVNPVIAECMNMICFQVMGNDACITHAAGAGQFELNVMMPVINYNILWSIEIMTSGVVMLTKNCIEGIEADAEHCAEYLASTLGLATVLNPVIGYHKASEVAREAGATGKSIRDIVLKKKILSEKALDKLLKQSFGPGYV